MSTFFARPQGNLLNYHLGKSTISLTQLNLGKSTISLRSTLRSTAFKTSK
jgi:hypothetical protein